MQNKLRKVLAILGVVAMLCTLLPLGSLSAVAADETIASWNFEDGNLGFTSGNGQQIVVDPDNSANHVLYWLTDSDYDTIHTNITLEKNTDYVFNFKMKSSSTGKVTVTVQTAGWGAYEHTYITPSTTWNEHTVEFNTGDTYDKIMLKFQVQGQTGQEFWIDDYTVTKKEKVVEPDQPGSGETTYESVLNMDWEDGVAKFKNASVVAEGPNGSNALKYSFGGGYSSTYITASGFEQNTEYLITFKAKASTSASMFITIQDGSWGSFYYNESFKPTTEWAEYSITTNVKTAPNNGKILFKFQDAGTALDLWVDDLSVAKVIKPEVEENENLLIDGSFENDGNGWKFNSGTHEIVTDAKDGSKALKLTNPSKWGEAAIQTVSIKANYQYELSFWAKRDSAPQAYNIVVCQSVSPWADFTKVSGTAYMNDTSGEWIQYKLVYESGSNTSMLVKFTAEKADAGSILIDDVVLKEIPQASDDGFIKNGDFETGSTEPWHVYSDTTVNKESANNGKYGLMASGNGKGYGGLAYQEFATEVGHSYAVTFSYKAVSSGVNVQIQDNGTNLASKYLNGTSWANYTLEFVATSTTTRINICGSGNDVTDTVYFDDFKVVEVKDPSFDGYIYNGDFEAGSLTKWSTYQETALSTSAAKNGKYGAILKGDGGWGGLLTQKDIAIEVGKTYKLSFWYKTPKNGLNMTLKDQDNQNTKLASNYLSGKQDWTLYEATFESGYVTKLVLNFSGSGKNTTDELWIDDIKLENLSGDEMDRCEVMKNSGTSIRDVDDNIKGLAFRFGLAADGIEIENGNQYVAGTGSLKLFNYDDAIGNLIGFGAVATNKESIGTTDFTLEDINESTSDYLIDIPAKYLLTKNEETGEVSYAVRIINIPDEYTDRVIYARPYYTYECEGEIKTVYGDITSDSYEAVASVRRSLKILAIGNSFSVDAMRNHLYDVLKSADYDQVILGNLYVGGCSLDMHWNYINGKQGAYEFHKNDDNGKWVKYDGYQALTALQEENWDVITVQQVSGNSGMPDTFGNLQNIVDWVNQYKTNPDAKVLWHMTWAYQQDSTHESFPNYNSDQMTMYNAIVDTVQNTVLNTEGIDGVIPSGTAIQNLRGALGDNLTADGYHLADNHGDYTAALTWYAAITGESLDKVTYAPNAVTNDVFNIKRAVGRAVINPYEVSDMGETVLIAGSDFQASTWDKNKANVNKLLGAIKENDGYELFDGMLFAGDYTPNHGHDNATEGIGVLDEFSSNFVIGNKVYAEGNHDAPTVEMLSPYGNNDPVGGTYGVFVFHEEDYGQFGDDTDHERTSIDVGNDLKAYFDEKIESGWDTKKPIFVMTHVPLHYNWRTVSDYGAGEGAQYIVDALNYGGELGYNVIFLYGHNHSGDYDSYLGGASIYLAKGDTMLIAKPENYKEYQEVELKFTYMNAGYVGYHVEQGADWTLTMTTFRIQDDGSVIITRYDENGYHNLKAAGKAHTPNEYVTSLPVNEDVYGPQRIVTATSDEEYTG